MACGALLTAVTGGRRLGAHAKPINPKTPNPKNPTSYERVVNK